MNYTSRYGLDFNPFIKNSKEILYENKNYEEVKIRLDYLLTTKGMGLISGEPGCGKTTIIRNWSQSLNQTAYKIIYLPLSTLTVLEAYRQLALALNVLPQHKKHQNFEEIQQAIRKLALEKKVTPIIIFDEANHLSNGFLNDLKILFNFDMDSRDLAVVLLVGQPIINNTLNLKNNEAIRQRIITSYNLEPMSQEESQKYIQIKLKMANANPQVFNEPALRAIASYAHGNPRIVSRVCDTSLMLGNALNANIINEEIVLKAINEVEI